MFAFLKDLGDNNERPWFHANKARYDAVLKEPALEFIEAFRPRLAAISPHFEANARAVGGSLFRIQRDTRFAKDKTPYKTNSGIHFRHERAKDAHAPGFYLHLEPRNCFMGVGLWRPEPNVARQIRIYMDEHRDEWTAITTTPPFSDHFELSGEALKRPPKGFTAKDGYDVDDPFIDELKRKDFIAMTKLTQGDVTKAGFMDQFESLAKAGWPLMAFLCAALELDC